jgi:N-acetylglucosaminyldiphosphoundecaprenol N-acetyl-beta-D-mannosaminyltransferase
MAADRPSRVQVLGLPVDVLTRSLLLDRVAELVRQGGRGTVAYLNVHVVNEAARDPGLRAFLREADLCYADGQGIVLGAKMLGQHLPERMTGADWIWDFAARAEAEGWRVAWVGGAPGVAEAACSELRARHPGLLLHAEHGFPSSEGLRLLFERIRDFGPHIVLVGMGTPTQELWVAEHRPALAAPVVWCLGATADFVSGRTHRGPPWLHDNAEWLARLITEPGRLWRRYLLGNPLYLARVLRQRLTGRTPG